MLLRTPNISRSINVDLAGLRMRKSNVWNLRIFVLINSSVDRSVCLVANTLIGFWHWCICTRVGDSTELGTLRGWCICTRVGDSTEPGTLQGWCICTRVGDSTELGTLQGWCICTRVGDSTELGTLQGWRYKAALKLATDLDWTVVLSRWEGIIQQQHCRHQPSRRHLPLRFKNQRNTAPVSWTARWATLCYSTPSHPELLQY